MKKGTPILWQRVSRIPVPRLLTLLLVCAGLMTGTVARSQCGVGTTRATLNWDMLDFFTNAANYTSDSYVENAATEAFIQNFAFGPSNRLTFNINNGIALGGELGAHTADLANYTGEDVMLTPGSSGNPFQMSFESDVTNLEFTLYDIDQSQVITITAVNGSGTNQNITVTTQAGTILTIAGTATAPTITAAGSSSALNSNNGTATVSISGPVRSVTVTFTARGNSEREIYLSDIHACVTGSFPLNYYAVSQPWTGQPGYILHAFDRSVYYVNPATGYTRFLFTDNLASSNGNVNSLGYDPYNRYIYYVFSLSSSGSARTMLRRYDVNTGTQSTIVNDLESIGVLTTSGNGTESGSASFYNGSYYIGVETSNSGRNSDREAVIWKIDFDGSNMPYRASQAFAQNVDSGGLLMHDWSDFVIHNGVLYNFDAAENDRANHPVSGVPLTPALRNQSDIYHYDMMTGNCIRYRKPGLTAVPLWYPGQPAIDWTGQVLQVFSSGGTPSFAGAMPASAPYITTYNGAGGIGTPTYMTANPAIPVPPPSLGDAGEAFRPRSDFGDAPASYDPDPQGPATHELDPLIRLGSGSVIVEWMPTHSALADAESNLEENGCAPGNLNFDATLTYTVPVSVFNNTGGQATLVAWLDYNFDGVFQASEGRSYTVNSSGTATNVNVQWTNIYVPPTSNLRTFMRVRVTRASNGMTVNNMNGWMSDGEVEDFPVLMGTALPKDIQSLNVKKEANATVNVKWSINVQQPVANYEILRSSDNESWATIGTVVSRDGFGLQNYTFNDLTPSVGTSYYRIRINYQATGANKLSEVRSVKLDVNNGYIRILPNPAHETAELQISSNRKDEAVVRVYDRTGRLVMNLKQGVDAGMNSIRINNLSKLAEGVYTIRTVVNGRTTSNQLIIKKQ